MASPGKIPTFAWNGLDTISPRLEGSRPPQALRICTGLGKPFPPSCTLFLSAAGVGALLPRTVRQRYGTKEKPPMALVGLTLGMGNLGNSTQPQGKSTLSKITQAHQKHRGLLIPCFTFPTVATPLTMQILPEDSRKCQPPPKKAPKTREIP